MLNDPIKTEDERNKFNFSAHRKHRNPRETSEAKQRGKPRKKTVCGLHLDKINITLPLSSKIPYPIVDRVRFEMTTDETGLKSYKLPLEGADRIEPVGSSSRCSHAYCIMLVP